jgi:serine phosphatase RsbU (regulator of sigma subunit)
MDEMDGMEQAALELLVRGLPFIEDLPADEINVLIQVLKIRHFPAATILFYEGDLADRLFILVQGEVEIVKSVGSEDERRLSSLKPVDIFGESSFLSPGRMRHASARTITPVLMLEMLHSDFKSLLLRQPHLGFHVMREMIVRWGASEQAIIGELKEKNLKLERAYEELKQAQEDLIEQERVEHELALAQRIQQGILPKEIPAPSGWQITAHWQPAHAVGGDFYDFIAFPNGKIGMLIGDATGKGIPAALVMATTCSILRAIRAGMDEAQGLTPGEVLSRANDLLCLQMPAGMFVTCLLALINPENGLLMYANAGHCLPCHITANGAFELRATGMPLGLLPGMVYEDKQVCIEPGDRVVLFSDGLLEAHDPLGQILGTTRVRQILAASPFSQADLISHILTSLADFTGEDWEQEDDLTLVSVKWSRLQS